MGLFSFLKPKRRRSNNDTDYFDENNDTEVVEYSDDSGDSGGSDD
ncbi:hypothetical protein [Methanooceanicella nereidis]|nr:hypothetical protein [Methanocella sp. CWC-04]